ncbi:MAG: methyltransferase domain-containing protein [Sphingomonadaceae bacterium]|nr:methyltransferase domain-containing protein [Sphingomonadaceae bacterium]
MRAGVALLAVALLLSGCDYFGDRPDSAMAFPEANRPVAPTVATRWDDEDVRDRLGEADDVMDQSDIRAGMTVADIGAGDGYYTVRLASRVGANGRVLAQDILPNVIERLGDRIARERLENVSIRLGAADDPRLPANSFDRVLMVHMYHEIAEPYAFLWRLWPALRSGGQVIVVDGNRPIANHGTPLSLLICEFQAVGYRPVAFVDKPNAGGYLVRFARAEHRPAPTAIRACK